MDKFVNIKHLLREAMRNCVIIIVVGVLLAALMAAKYIKDVRLQAQSVQYGSMSTIEAYDVERTAEDSFAVKNSVLKGSVGYMVRSDEVLSAVAGKLNSSQDEEMLRSMIYYQSDVTGVITKVYVVSSDQSEAQTICSLVSEETVNYVKSCGFSADILQAATEIGPVSVAYRDDANNPEHKYTMVSTTDVPAVAMSSLIKKVIVGFVVGAFLAYAVICLLYLLRGRLIYSEEVSEMGIPLLCEVRKKQRSRDFIDSACNIALGLDPEGCSGHKVALVQYGNDLDLGELEEACKNNNVDIKTVSDIIKDPQKKMLMKDTSDVVFVVRRNTVKTDTLQREAELIRNIGKRFLGVVFVD